MLTSPWYDLANYVFTEIQAMGLLGISAQNIYLDRIPKDWDIVLPSIFVTPYESEEVNEGNFEQNDYTFPVTVTTVTAANQGVTLRRQQFDWRFTIQEYFNGNSVPSVPGVDICQVVPGIVFDPGLFHDNNLSVQVLTLKFSYRGER